MQKSVDDFCNTATSLEDSDRRLRAEYWQVWDWAFLWHSRVWVLLNCLLIQGGGKIQDCFNNNSFGNNVFVLVLLKHGKLRRYVGGVVLRRLSCWSVESSSVLITRATFDFLLLVLCWLVFWFLVFLEGVLLMDCKPLLLITVNTITLSPSSGLIAISVSTNTFLPVFSIYSLPVTHTNAVVPHPYNCLPCTIFPTHD